MHERAATYNDRDFVALVDHLKTELDDAWRALRQCGLLQFACRGDRKHPLTNVAICDNRNIQRLAKRFFLGKLQAHSTHCFSATPGPVRFTTMTRFGRPADLSIHRRYSRTYSRGSGNRAFRRPRCAQDSCIVLRVRYLRAGLWTNGSQSRAGIETNKAMGERGRDRRVELQRQQVVFPDVTVDRPATQLNRLFL